MPIPQTMRKVHIGPYCKPDLGLLGCKTTIVGAQLTIMLYVSLRRRMEGRGWTAELDLKPN